MVESSTASRSDRGEVGDGFSYIVDKRAVLEGRFEDICECGMPMSSAFTCKHEVRSRLITLILTLTLTLIRRRLITITLTLTQP